MQGGKYRHASKGKKRGSPDIEEDEKDKKNQHGREIGRKAESRGKFRAQAYFLPEKSVLQKRGETGHKQRNVRRKGGAGIPPWRKKKG